MKISDISTEKINICGRTTAAREPLSLVWGGSFVEFHVKASEFRILLAGPYTTYENWIAIEINGEILSRRMVSKDKEWITVFRMMNPDKETIVKIIKETQAFESDAEHRLDIYEIETDGELLEVNKDKLRIEFIGDSITSAEGCIGAKCEEDWRAQIFSHTNSYPYMTGKKLDADIQVFSQSGWGTYASWDCKENCALPLYYEDIYSLMSYNPANRDSFFAKQGFYEPWDFLSWQPDVVVINLGTNDDGAFHNEECENKNLLKMQGTELDEEDRLKVRNACVDFLKTVRKNNPDALMVWAFGMLECKIAVTIKEAVEIYKKEQSDEQALFVELPPVTDETVGSRFHPGRKAHKKAAKVIVQTIKKEVLK